MSGSRSSAALSPSDLNAHLKLADLLDSPGIAVGTEHRVDERYEVQGEAEVQLWREGHGSSLLRGTILDISATGCYLQSRAPIRVRAHTIVDMVFSIYETNFRVQAISRYTKTKVGIGFRFLEMDEDTRDQLRSVLSDIRSKLLEDAPKAAFPIVDRQTAA